jgi:hypothetical protein
MFVSSLAYEPAFPPEWEGLDLASAENAIPHWYGVSSGNGNDGVSRTWPNYYVRTCEPYALARCAMLSEFKEGEGQAFALESMEIDGEAEYGITTMILDPPDDEAEAEPAFESTYHCDSCNHEWTDESELSNRTCPKCGESEEVTEEPIEAEPEDSGSWSEFNGAWLIIEVFRIEPEDMPERGPYDRMQYASLQDAFTSDLIALASED